MSLGRLLLEQGMEIELQTDIRKVISFLDDEVPNFSYDGDGYRINSSRGVLGSQWTLLVKTWHLASETELNPTVGLMEVNKLERGGISFKIPPRVQWGDEEDVAFDEDGSFFFSFVCQLLNALQSRGLVDLPGKLPIR